MPYWLIRWRGNQFDGESAFGFLRMGDDFMSQVMCSAPQVPPFSLLRSSHALNLWLIRNRAAQEALALGPENQWLGAYWHGNASRIQNALQHPLEGAETQNLFSNVIDTFSRLGGSPLAEGVILFEGLGLRDPVAGELRMGWLQSDEARFILPPRHRLTNATWNPYVAMNYVGIGDPSRAVLCVHRISDPRVRAIFRPFVEPLDAVAAIEGEFLLQPFIRITVIKTIAWFDLPAGGLDQLDIFHPHLPPFGKKPFSIVFTEISM